MIIDLSDDGKFVVISALRTPDGLDPSAVLRDLRLEIPRTELQFFDATRIAGMEHLKIAAINALHAFKRGIGISRSLAMETLLYASGQRQIDVAIEMLGVAQNSEKVGFVAFCESRSLAEDAAIKIGRSVGKDLDESLLADWSKDKLARIATAYGISRVELGATKMPGQKKSDAVTKAVIERVALLSTRT